MTHISAINLSMPFKLGVTNCYLMEDDNNFILIDTGGSNRRRQLIGELEGTGCKPGMLKLIILTHGDFDHCGNAAYLRHQFGARVAMHGDDSGMVELGDMFVNRKQPGRVVGRLISSLSGFGKQERFKPDLVIGEGSDLSEYQLDVRVLSLPGHSKGSIGILTARGDLFCGDLLENLVKPSLNSIMDDLVAAQNSLKKLRGYDIKTVYPGHGKPFSMEQFLTTER
jgi:hydroxyacylglutathione hydrolase